MTRTIRLARPADALAIADIYAPYCKDSAITFETVPVPTAQMAERMQRLGEKYPWIVVDIDGQVAGYAYAGQHHERAAYRWATNVSVYVAEAHHRTGIGRALYESLFAILGLQGFTQAIGGITLPNDPSVGLHESLGFTLVGIYRNIGYKLGAWRDVGWWQRPLAHNGGEPSEPLLMRAVESLPAFPDALAGRKPRVGQ